MHSAHPVNAKGREMCAAYIRYIRNNAVSRIIQLSSFVTCKPACMVGPMASCCWDTASRLPALQCLYARSYVVHMISVQNLVVLLLGGPILGISLLDYP